MLSADFSYVVGTMKSTLSWLISDYVGLVISCVASESCGRTFAWTPCLSIAASIDELVYVCRACKFTRIASTQQCYYTAAKNNRFGHRPRFYRSILVVCSLTEKINRFCGRGLKTRGYTTNAKFGTVRLPLEFVFDELRVPSAASQ